MEHLLDIRRLFEKHYGNAQSIEQGRAQYQKLLEGFSPDKSVSVSALEVGDMDGRRIVPPNVAEIGVMINGMCP